MQNFMHDPKPEPPQLQAYLKRHTPFQPKAMIGKTVKYRLPISNGWIVLTGTVVNATDTAIVVREKTLGGKSTIRPDWFVGYVWELKNVPLSQNVSQG